VGFHDDGGGFGGQLGNVLTWYNNFKMESLPNSNPNTPVEKPSAVQEPGKVLEKKTRRGGKKRVPLIVGGVLFVALIIAFLVYLFIAPASTTARIRDVFIILLAFTSILIGIAIVILAIQFATLANLVQNELKPILNSTNETVNHLRGTSEFLSDNLVEPVIKLNEYLSIFKRLSELLNIVRK
jgi:hypothetical protein